MPYDPNNDQRLSAYWIQNEPDVDDELIRDRVREYLSQGNELDPFDWENFTVAIESLKQEDVNSIVELARNKDFKLLGLYVWSSVYEYFEKIAEEKALDEWNSGSLKRCDDE